MSKYIFGLLIFLFTGELHSQAPFPGSSEIKQFLESKTGVVLEDDLYSAYNVYIKKAVQEYWEITPREFIGSVDFEERRRDPSWSFLVLTETNFDRDKSNSNYNFLNLLQGKDVDDMSMMPEICAVPLSFAGEDDMEYGYKMGAVLSFIQNHARMISQDPSQTGRRYLRYYNRNIPQIAGKVILVRQEDLSPSVNSQEKISALYKNRMEIVSEEEIIKAIHDKSPGTLIFHMVSPAGNARSGYCFKMLIGTDDADMYYYNQQLIDKNNPRGLLPADLKRLSRF